MDPAAPVRTVAPRDGSGWLILGVAGLLLRQLSVERAIDADVFHGMALAREAWATGAVPVHDMFAYTPTLDPVVHHEWGTGFILYGVWHGLGLGTAGLAALRYALVAALLAVVYRSARLRGATVASVAIAAPLAIFFLAFGLAPVRAQIFSYLLFALLLWFLELDQRGVRSWIPVWLALHLVWVNLHAGFVVGLGAIAVTLVERWARAGLREGARGAGRLAAVLAAASALVVVNPWRGAYVAYLWRALRMTRPLISEWAALWDPRVDRVVAAAFLFALALVVYTAWKVGPRQITGLPLVAVTASAAAGSHRHLPMFAIAWFAAVAPVLPSTELGRMVADLWTRRRALVAVGALGCAVAGGALTIARRAWDLTVPADPGGGWRSYPVAAVDALARMRFEGRVLTAFEIGSYVSWRLHPAVRVSLDTRYEAAFQPGVLEDQLRLERTEPGWASLLEAHRPDAVLLGANAPLARVLARSPEWRVVDDDTRWMLLVRR